MPENIHGVPDSDAHDEFGFGSLPASTRDRIRQIKPASPPELPVEIARVDAAAENIGFRSREVAPQPEPYPEFVPRRALRPEPRIPLNMRTPVSLGNAFQRFCEENRYSYPEGLAEIMRRAGLPLK